LLPQREIARRYHTNQQSRPRYTSLVDEPLWIAELRNWPTTPITSILSFPVTLALFSRTQYHFNEELAREVSRAFLRYRSRFGAGWFDRFVETAIVTRSSRGSFLERTRQLTVGSLTKTNSTPLVFLAAAFAIYSPPKTQPLNGKTSAKSGGQTPMRKRSPQHRMTEKEKKSSTNFRLRLRKFMIPAYSNLVL